MTATALKQNDSLEGFHPAIGGFSGEDNPVDRPEDMPQKEDCTHIVSTAQELADAVEVDNAIIWLDETAGEILFKGPQDIWLGNDVTIVGQYCDPEYPGIGTYVKQDYYHRHLFLSAYGKAPTLWGVPLIGPMLGDSFFDSSNEITTEDVYFDPRSDERSNDGELEPSAWYAGGLFCYDDKTPLHVYGCLFAGWSVAGLEIGAKNHETQAEIQRSTFVLNGMETLGYGVEAYNGHQWYNRCFFDGNRHDISGFGYPTHSYEVTESVCGLLDGCGHDFDMHDWTAENNIGGHHVKLRNVSFLSQRDIRGYDQEGYAQRGVPDGEDEIWLCAFVHPEKPEEPGDQGDAFRQETPEQRDSWENFNPHDNVFGTTHHGKYGAPLAPADNKPDRYDRLLEINGSGETTNYRIVVDGGVQLAKPADESETVIENDDGTVTLEGFVVGYRDAFRLADDAEIVAALRDGEMTLVDNGEEVPLDDLLAAYVWHYT